MERLTARRLLVSSSGFASSSVDGGFTPKPPGYLRRENDFLFLKYPRAERKPEEEAKPDDETKTLRADGAPFNKRG
jgi:hypothetical protein